MRAESRCNHSVCSVDSSERWDEERGQYGSMLHDSNGDSVLRASGRESSLKAEHASCREESVKATSSRLRPPFIDILVEIFDTI